MRARLEIKFFWILLLGVIFFFGLLTYLIIRRESSLLMSFYMNNSAKTAHVVSMQLKEHMLKARNEDIIRYLETLNSDPDMKVGVLGPEGTPVFGTDIEAPPEIFSAQESVSIPHGDALAFFRPLKNEKQCHACHNPLDNTRGMIVIKTSLKNAMKEMAATKRRLIYYGLFLGALSEIFLIIVARKMILTPVNALRRGAENLKEGKFGYRVDVKSADEMGYLADVFNQMAERIEEAQIYLEKTVAQKTNELRAIAELSTEVFKGDLTLNEIIKQFLDSIIFDMGYTYSALCLVDKETGLLHHEYKKGIENGFCHFEIPLSSDHPFARVVKEAVPAIRKSSDVGVPETYGNIAIIPILSHQRRRCREINCCTYAECPAFNSPDERCWLMEGTLCRSPIAVPGKEKIYGCLHCDVFPVLGVILAGKSEDITEVSLHSLEILASEIASAIENIKLIEGHKTDIQSLVKLHDISVEKLQYLDVRELSKSIVSSATAFANMDAAILWLKDEDGTKLNLESVSNIERSLVPKTLPVNDSFVGRAILERRIIETIKPHDVGCLDDLIKDNRFLYIATVPLNFKDAVYGCLSLFKRKDFFMADSEKALISLFASQSAAAINMTEIYQEMNAQKEFSDAIFNNMSMAIMVFDEKGRIIKLNKAGFGILGIEDYVVGRRLEEVLPDASEFLVLEPSLNREAVLSAGDKKIPIGFGNSPLMDINGRQTGIVVVFRDLTEIKKLQAEIRKKQHYEAMEKVIAGVAHEIRNPLFGISAIAQILSREVHSAEHQSLLQAMLKETNRMKNLLEELLLYSRPSSLDIAEIDLNILMEKIKHYVTAKRSDVALDIRIPHPFMVNADIDKLTQVFLNLVDNAMNAEGKNLALTAEVKEDKAVITLKDDGIGIKEPDMDRIFEPFFTTRKEGTGLGLSICKKIVDNHGGTLSITSSEGDGTTVQITLNL